MNLSTMNYKKCTLVIYKKVISTEPWLFSQQNILTMSLVHIIRILCIHRTLSPFINSHAGALQLQQSGHTDQHSAVNSPLLYLISKAFQLLVPAGNQGNPFRCTSLIYHAVYISLEFFPKLYWNFSLNKGTLLK